jgi:hypothetical protein
VRQILLHPLFGFTVLNCSEHLLGAKLVEVGLYLFAGREWLNESLRLLVKVKH